MKSISTKRFIVFFAIAIVAIVALIKFGFWLYYRYTHAITEDAFVEADIINVSPLVAGHIKKIYVDESQKVKKGELLFKIDDKDYRASVEVRRAQYKAAQEELKVLRRKLSQALKDYELSELVLTKKVKIAEAALKEAEAAYERAKKDYYRFLSLYKKRVIGKRKFDLVKEEFKRKKALYLIRKVEVAVAKDNLKQLDIKLEKIKEIKRTIEATVKKVKVAKKALNEALVKLSHTKVVSPIDGIVTKKYLFEGDFVSPGIPVLALYDPQKIYVIANLEETRFKGVDIGDPVDIKVDAYPGKVFKGRVYKIIKASAAKFALIPRDVTAGEFTKVVQRIPIKIEIVDKDKDKLIPGMSVEIGIKR